MSLLHKTEIQPIDGTPLKRMFYSIISDYDFKTAVCELVDNAIDLWSIGPQQGCLEILISADPDQQSIEVRDNAGGIELDDLRLLVVPGGSRNSLDAEVIGVF